MSVFKTAGTWFVYATNFQIIGLSETWLHNSITNHEILPKAYSIYSKDRGSRDPKKARCIGTIPSIVLKYCGYALALPLHHLFTSSITCGAIPSEWKMYKIINVINSVVKISD